MMTPEFMELADRVRRLSLHMGIPGIGLDDALVLYALAFSYSAGRGGVAAADLGAGIGYSTLWMAKGLEEGCLAPCSLDAVEVVEERAARAESLFRKHRFRNVEVRVVRGEALEYLSSLRDESIDFVFVDVDKAHYPEVLGRLAHKLRDHGVAVFHNAVFPPPPRAFLSMAREPPWVSSIIPTDLGLLVAVKGK